jgi:hypothetical protein
MGMDRLVAGKSAALIAVLCVDMLLDAASGLLFQRQRLHCHSFDADDTQQNGQHDSYRQPYSIVNAGSLHADVSLSEAPNNFA